MKTLFYIIYQNSVRQFTILTLVQNHAIFQKNFNFFSWLPNLDGCTWIKCILLSMIRKFKFCCFGWPFLKQRQQYNTLSIPYCSISNWLNLQPYLILEIPKNNSPAVHYSLNFNGRKPQPYLIFLFEQYNTPATH